MAYRSYQDGDHLDGVFLRAATIALLCIGLAACGGSAAASPPSSGGGRGSGVPSAAPPSPIPNASAALAAPVSPVATTTSGPSGTATAVDPCDLVTASEAAQLAGISLGAPQGGGPSMNGTPTCTYAISRPWDILWVVVFRAPDPATAQADWAQEETQTEKSVSAGESNPAPAITLTLADVTVQGADKAAAATVTAPFPAVSGTGSAAAILALKGSVFVAITDVYENCPNLNLYMCGPQSAGAPTVDALRAQMATALSRLP